MGRAIALGAGLHEVVKASLARSILGNILLVMGASMLAGGAKRDRQNFEPRQVWANTRSLPRTPCAGPESTDEPDRATPGPRARVRRQQAPRRILRSVPYDHELAARIRTVVADEPGLTEKQMFGGIAFLINGNMAVAASSQGGLLLRVEPERTDALIREARAARAVMRGREMNGWLRVDTQGITAAAMQRWIGEGLSYARSLPPK